MTHTEHTPGPWAISQSPEIFANDLVIYRLHPDGGKGHIVTSLCDPAKYKNCTNFTPDEQKANARLIAAAPKLLAACRMVVDRWERGDLGEAARACAAAIAEATGKAA